MADATVGDSITINWGDETYTGTATLNANGDVVVIVPSSTVTAAGDGDIAVISKIGDGDESQATVIEVDTIAPTITAFGSTAADGSYAVGDVMALSATLSESVTAGSTVAVTLNTGESVTLGALSDGTTLTGSYTVTASGSDVSDLTVSTINSVSLTDAAGNTTTSATLADINNIAANSDIVIDATAPTITAVTPSWGDYLNATEDDSDGTVTITTSGVEDGQTVTVTINSKDYTATVNGNSAQVTVPADDLQALTDGDSYTITANVSDAAGNAAIENSTAGFDVDTTAPSDSDISVSASSEVDGCISGMAEAGSAVVVTFTDDGTPYSYTTTADGSGDWSVDVTSADVSVQTPDLVNGDELSVSVSATDVAGNVSVEVVSNTTVILDSTVTVVFDLTTGYSGADDGTTTFLDDVVYTIYIVVDSDDYHLTKSNLAVFTGGGNLGYDDLIVLVGDDGSKVQGQSNGSVSAGVVDHSYFVWNTGAGGLSGAAGVHSCGSFYRVDGKGSADVDLWAGDWEQMGTSAAGNYIDLLPTAVTWNSAGTAFANV